MPRVQSPRRTLITLLAVAALVVLIAAPAGAGPPTTLSWGVQFCDDPLSGAILAVDGKGRWANIEVEASVDGQSFFQLVQQRVEKGSSVAHGFTGDQVWLRARQVKNNGAPFTNWFGTFVDCST